MRMVIENHVLRIEIQPDLGGKITSFYHKEKKFEISAQSNKKIEDIPGVCVGFAPYAFGMDDAFPNIDAEIINWNGNTISYPDHGEVWSAEFRILAHSADCVILGWESPMGYRYTKTLQLDHNALRMHCDIKNNSGKDFPCFWTWHGLMRYEEDMEVILPEGTTHCRNVLTGPELGDAGTVYPISGSYDFTRVPKAESRTMSKFYVEHPVRDGRCGIYYPSSNIACILEYDAKILPYLGVWVTAGGFQGDYNCAMEPTNGFYDSISNAWGNGKLPILHPGESLHFKMTIKLQCGKTDR